MLHLGDHAPRLRRIRQFHDAADAIEAEPDQRRALGMMRRMALPVCSTLMTLSLLLISGLSAPVTGF